MIRYFLSGSPNVSRFAAQNIHKGRMMTCAG